MKVVQLIVLRMNHNLHLITKAVLRLGAVPIKLLVSPLLYFRALHPKELVFRKKCALLWWI